MHKLTVLLLISFIALSAQAQRKVSLITGDIGGSTGTNNGNTYQEVHLGVNLNFTDWLTWRNSGFQRTGSKIKEVTGLDSSLRLVLRTQFQGGGGANFFLGPGYRWTSISEYNAATAEAGLGFNAGGFGMSAGAKYLKYDKPRVNSDGEALKDEDVNYFVSISGNTSFGK